MANKVIAICGAGPGISYAVAEKFGKEGFKVALLSRTKPKLDDLVAGLTAQGITAQAFPADAADPQRLKAALTEAKEALGPITVLHWNVYPAAARSSLLTMAVETMDHITDVGIKGLLVAVQTVVPGMKEQEGAAILASNGGDYKFDEMIEKIVVKIAYPGWGYVNCAKHKIMRLLKLELADMGIFVGEVCVGAVVKGTAFDKGNGTLEAVDVAMKFWEQYTASGPDYLEVC